MALAAMSTSSCLGTSPLYQLLQEWTSQALLVLWNQPPLGLVFVFTNCTPPPSSVLVLDQMFRGPFLSLCLTKLYQVFLASKPKPT